MGIAKTTCNFKTTKILKILSLLCFFIVAIRLFKITPVTDRMSLLDSTTLRQLEGSSCAKTTIPEYEEEDLWWDRGWLCKPSTPDAFSFWSAPWKTLLLYPLLPTSQSHFKRQYQDFLAS